MCLKATGIRVSVSKCKAFSDNPTDREIGENKSKQTVSAASLVAMAKCWAEAEERRKVLFWCMVSERFQSRKAGMAWTKEQEKNHFPWRITGAL